MEATLFLDLKKQAHSEKKSQILIIGLKYWAMLGRTILLIFLTLAVNIYCVKSVQIRSFFWSNTARIRENTDWKELRIWTLLILFLSYYKSYFDI